MIRRLALLAVATPLLLIPATATAKPPDPSMLPMGDVPAVTWQSGTTVHTAGGKTVHLPLGKAGNAYEVLGKRKGEWIVGIPGYDHDHTRVLAVKGTKVRTVWKHVYDESGTDYTLARGGSLVVEWNYDRAGATTAVVFDLRGKVVARRHWGGGVNLLDFSGDTMLIRMWADKTGLWSVPGKPVAVAPDAEYGDLDGDLLWVTLPQDSSGPTSLSAPGMPAWSSTTFHPELLSPDGQYIAGRDFTNKYTLSVRQVVDGTELPIPGFRFYADSTLTWEPDGSLLVEMRTASGHFLVRCTMAGVCTRTTAYVQGRHLGFPA